MITLTEIGQSNQINDQFLIELFSRKELIRRKIEIFKTEIERFYWREEYGFSTRDCLTEISLSYNEILMDLKEMVKSFEDLIGQEGETDWEEEIYEYIETVMELKFKNLHIFKKIVQKREKSRNHKPTMRSTMGTMRSTLDNTMRSTLGTMRSTLDNTTRSTLGKEAPKEAPNLVKNSDWSENRDKLEFLQKIKEAPNLVFYA